MNMLTSILVFIIAPALVAMAILAARSYFDQPRKWKHWRDIKPRLSWRLLGLWWRVLDFAEICRALFGGRSPRQPKFKYRIDTLRR